MAGKLSGCHDTCASMPSTATTNQSTASTDESFISSLTQSAGELVLVGASHMSVKKTLGILAFLVVGSLGLNISVLIWNVHIVTNYQQEAHDVKPDVRKIASLPNCDCEVTREPPVFIPLPGNLSGLPQPATIDFSNIVADSVYEYQSREDVREAARGRLSVIDGFTEPNADLCTSVLRQRELSVPAARRSFRGLVVMWIHSAASHFTRRKMAREMWASRSLYHSIEMPVIPVFAVGHGEYESMMERESRVHKDMVVLNYQDTYHNVTYKAVGGMRWVTKYCPQATGLLKVDDDTLVVPSRLVRWLREERIGRQNLTIHAHYVFKKVTKNNEDNKWHLRDTEWPPKYIANLGAPGLAYFLTTDLLPYMYEAIRAVPWIWLEDVWITGTLPEALIAAGVPVNRLKFVNRTLKHDSELIKDNLTKKNGIPNTIFIGQMPLSWSFYRRALIATDQL